MVSVLKTFASRYELAQRLDYQFESSALSGFNLFKSAYGDEYVEICETQQHKFYPRNGFPQYNFSEHHLSYQNLEDETNAYSYFQKRLILMDIHMRNSPKKVPSPKIAADILRQKVHERFCNNPFIYEKTKIPKYHHTPTPEQSEHATASMCPMAPRKLFYKLYGAKVKIDESIIEDKYLSFIDAIAYAIRSKQSIYNLIDSINSLQQYKISLHDEEGQTIFLKSTNGDSMVSHRLRPGGDSI